METTDTEDAMPQRDAQKSEVHETTDDATASPASDVNQPRKSKGRQAHSKSERAVKQSAEKTTGNSGPSRTARQG